MKTVTNFFRALSEVRRFNSLPLEQREFVFYAEDAGSYAHFSEMLQKLTGEFGKTACYLTSSSSDPILSSPPAGVRPFFIGHGIVRTYLFQTLRAGVMVMTMPDLETFHLKRSRYHPVKYAYVFHSMVSTHAIYRETAFDHFDAIFCVGDHHIIEIKKREALFSLPAKQLCQLGYGRLDSLQRQAKGEARPANDPLRITIAPSWGPDGLLENHAEVIVEKLLDYGFGVTLRPHPRTLRSHRSTIESLAAKHSANPCFKLDVSSHSDQTFRTTDVLVSDWSGAAFEFAFAFERPVLFVEVPQKINNPNFAKLDLEPIEKKLRHQLGTVLALGELPHLGATIAKLHAGAEEFQKGLRKVRAKTVYNLGSSGRAGAQYLVEMSATSLSKRQAHAK